MSTSKTNDAQEGWPFDLPQGKSNLAARTRAKVKRPNADQEPKYYLGRIAPEAPTSAQPTYTKHLGRSLPRPPSARPDRLPCSSTEWCPRPRPRVLPACAVTPPASCPLALSPAPSQDHTCAVTPPAVCSSVPIGSFAPKANPTQPPD
ncbi:extensin-like [Musa acuminata AAA Group]|uniref:extensin-like n=1 Tax=Musa acuminata AAA Group TaxID=214697 RepID=UPI0031DE2760